MNNVSGSLTGTLHRDRTDEVSGYLTNTLHTETLRLVALERAFMLKEGEAGLMDFSHHEPDTEGEEEIEEEEEIKKEEEEEEGSEPPSILVHIWEYGCAVTYVRPGHCAGHPLRDQAE